VKAVDEIVLVLKERGKKRERRVVELEERPGGSRLVGWSQASERFYLEVVFSEDFNRSQEEGGR
jgi:hypothetical protein